ncbi:helix-turn-helix domain-containing protein [Streptomyces sp. NPDC059564]|uniref:helix-turn-helix domain-containing protein n=1 Tax=Streptomyces sp. NPDC059564 TaxID=3346865 RepID=UPI00369ED89E
MSFGNDLRARRLAEGLSLSELSKVVHYSKGHLSRIETGRKQASEDLARRCDDALRAQGRLALAHEKTGSAGRPRAGLPLPAQLPPATRGFVGRAQMLAALDRALPSADGAHRGGTPVCVTGTAGVGKTAFALEWAHRNASAFPDGILFHDMRAHGPDGTAVEPYDVLPGFLHALGVEPERVPGGLQDRAAMYRSLLAGSRVLVVLDNVATAEQVRTLLPGSPHCGVLVTSRNRLPGLVVREGAVRITLEALSPDESCELLHAVTEGTGLSTRQADRTVLLELARQCGYLPLALRIAAEHYSTGQYARLDDMVAELNDGSALFDLLACANDVASSIRSVFSWSYQALEKDEARAFRVVAPHSRGGVSVQVAADLLGVPERVALRQLDALYQAQLLGRAEPGRYSTTALLGAYAAELAGALND